MQATPRKFRAFVLGLALLGGLASAHADRADRDAPMAIEADALRHDDAAATSVFNGNVRITKGSIRIRGDRVTLKQNPQGHAYGQVEGSAQAPAFYRQKRENLDEFIEGEALRLDYDGRADSVVLVGQARLRRLRGATVADAFQGERITYDSRTEVFAIDGASPGGTTGGRVKAMLTPAPQAAASQPGTLTLQPSAGLGRP